MIQLKLFLFTLFLAAILAVLVLLGTNSGFGSSGLPYYESYGQAIRAGHLWVGEASSVGECGWDQSFYKGKCYLYWGVLPGLLHAMLPFASDRFLTFLACILSIYFLILIINHTASFHLGCRQPDLPRAVPVFGCSILATCLPSMVLVARVYEESIVFGTLFALLGAYFLLPTFFPLNPDRRYSYRVCLGILFLVFAGLSRSSWFGTALILVLALGFQCLRLRNWELCLVTLLSLFIFIVGLFTQLLLNYLRFESYFNFGLSYQAFISELNRNQHIPFSPLHILKNLASYSFASLPPTNSILRSWVHPEPLKFFWISDLFASKVIFREFVLGLVWSMPLVIPGFFLLWRHRIKYRANLGLALAFSLPAVPALAVNGPIYRYQADVFIGCLLVLAPALIVFGQDNWSRVRSTYWISFVFGLLLVGYNTVWLVKVICRNYC